MYALEDTNWDVHTAIKLLKLKQLLSTQLADQDKCKQVLMDNAWNISVAANVLSSQSGYRKTDEVEESGYGSRISGRDSPELVHV